MVGLSVTTLGLGLHSVSTGSFVKGPGLGQGSGLGSGSGLGRNRRSIGGVGKGVGSHTLIGGSLTDSDDGEEEEDGGMEMGDMDETGLSPVLALLGEDNEEVMGMGSLAGSSSSRRSPATSSRKQYLHHHTSGYPTIGHGTLGHGSGGPITPTPQTASLIQNHLSQGTKSPPPPLPSRSSSSSHRRSTHGTGTNVSDVMMMSRQARGDSTGSFVMEFDGKLSPI